MNHVKIYEFSVTIKVCKRIIPNHFVFLACTSIVVIAPAQHAKDLVSIKSLLRLNKYLNLAWREGGD